MTEILQQLINALLLGCTYTLIAIGFSFFSAPSMWFISLTGMSVSLVRLCSFSSIAWPIISGSLRIFHRFFIASHDRPRRSFDGSLWRAA
jgi:hypothetical protein